MTLDFTQLMKPLLAMPIIGIALLMTGILVDRLRTGILVDRLRRRRPEPDRP